MIVKFNKEILIEYLNHFNFFHLDDILYLFNEKKQNKIKLELEKGETDIKNLEKISNELKINVYRLFFREFSEEKIFIEFKKQNKNISLEKKTQATLRKYQNIRKDIQALEDKEHHLEKKYTIKDNPQEIAAIYREKFCFDSFLKEGRKKNDDVFKYIREKIEEEGIYIFKNNINEKGGDYLEENLSACIFLDGNLAPLILLNSSYDEISQIGNLLHEFAHFLLGISEIEVEENYNKTRVEQWCNKFAYYFFITDEIEKKEKFTKENYTNLDINYLKFKYFVSKKSLMTRFRILDIVSQKEYYDFINKNYKERKPETNKTRGKGGNFHNTKKERTSSKYIELIADNYYSNKISQCEAEKYLGLKINRLNNYL